MSTAWTLGSSSGIDQRLLIELLDGTAHAVLLTAEIHAVATSDIAAGLSKMDGDNQTATVGEAVAVSPSVKVTDQYGNAVSGASVTWRVTSGGGSVHGGSVASVSNDAGVAQIPGAWTLGTTAGANTLTASIDGGSVLFTAVSKGGVPARLTFIVAPSSVATNGQPLPQQPVVQLQDQYGNATKISDVVVQITQLPGSTTGRLTILNDTTKTNADGVATFTATTINGPINDGYRLGFTAPMTSTISSDPISVLAGQPYALALVRPASGAVRGQQFALYPGVSVVDVGGNGAPVNGCVNAAISPGASLTGSTQVAGNEFSFEFIDLGISSTSDAGTFTITYTTGCGVPDGLVLPVSQQIEIP